MSLVEMSGISKSYFGVEVLHEVNFTLEAGTVHALMGENGAGKSTLVKVLAGIHKADRGTVKIEGKEVDIGSPAQAAELGVAMVHQELSPIYEMTVAENIFLGREPGAGGFVDAAQLTRQTKELLDTLSLQINPKEKMKNLRVADQQMVEIAKAISRDARILIMDEPTSAITDREIDRLFAIIEDLKARGTGIIYISHKMDEIFRIADKISVLRDGNEVGTWDKGDVNIDMLIKSMVGRELEMQYPKISVPIGEVVLEVENLSLAGQYEDISFQLRRGEILAFVGLVGSGRTELMHSLFGVTHPDSGRILYEGREIHFKKPKDAIDSGFAYVTEDRKKEGLVMPMNIQHNVSLSALFNYVKGGLIDAKHESGTVQGQVDALSIKCTSSRQLVKSLSGGNQQKVVVAKWMLNEPKIIIFDEPTRGIDVGAKAEIYKIMGDYVSRGNAVIMITSEMPEAMGVADRIVVLSDRKKSGELKRDEFSQEAIVKLEFLHMMGGGAK
ncbi:MAG: sugar ABC transporter ATP-binding protein [Clostridiales Family XIII bacterium]|jgi:ABC-type sugar transport system ATPase subunit|nr:sugar ABC transporter ATP-binding protein [Clostridiales Family XIII bacterium]